MSGASGSGHEHFAKVEDGLPPKKRLLAVSTIAIEDLLLAKDCSSNRVH